MLKPVTFSGVNFLQILPEDTKTELKEAAVISMGTEVCDLDLIKYQRPL